MTTARMMELPIGTDATLVVQASRKRVSLVLTNSGATTIYLSNDKNVTVGDGYPLLPGNTLNTDKQESWWGLSSGAGSSIGVLDECG